MEVAEKNRLRVCQIMNWFISGLDQLKLQEKKKINTCEVNEGLGIALCYRLENKLYISEISRVFLIV